MKEEKTYYDCVCGCTTIKLTLYKDWNDTIELCMLTYGSSYKAWYQRFRYIWQVLIYGKPYTDQVELTPKTAKRLAENLEKIVEKTNYELAD